MLLDFEPILFSPSLLDFNNTGLTERLVEHTWKQLHTVGITPLTYHTAACLWKNDHPLPIEQTLPFNNGNQQTVFLERFPEEPFELFFKEQDLVPLSFTKEEKGLVVSKLQNAFSVIDKITDMAADVRRLVRSIVVLHSEHEAIDISYSHPNIPLSIFISIGAAQSEIMNLRVAESIIHEAMHLKLSMFESFVPLVNPQREAKIYSPWRLEPRPVQGVLHGLFVFRMLFDFYAALSNHYREQRPVLQFIEERREGIFREVSEVRSLIEEETLTHEGGALAAHLLKIKLF